MCRKQYRLTWVLLALGAGCTLLAQVPSLPRPPQPGFERFAPLAPGGMDNAMPPLQHGDPATPLNGSAPALRPIPAPTPPASALNREWNEAGARTFAYNGQFRFARMGTPVADARDQAFEEARTVLERMLDGREPLLLRRAIAAVEQPLLNDAAVEQELSDLIDRLAALVQERVKAQGGRPDDPIAIHLGIQSLYRDTFVDPLSGATWMPLRYDFEDPNGEQDIAQVTVSKLLRTGEGQCRSMPLLYLALAERLHVEAYLAFAPNHSFVKFRDRSGTFHNFETTNGRLASDAWIAGSGYVKTEGIKSRAYLDTVGTRQVVAHLLVELAIYYEQLHGYNEPFMEACLRDALAAYPQDIHGWMELSNLRTASFDRAAWQAGYPPLDALNTSDPSLAQRLTDLKALYTKVDRMGYAPMPPEVYARWRSSVDAAKEERLRKELDPPLRSNLLAR